MTDKDLAQKLLSIIEKWEITWDFWANDDNLKRLLKNEFDSDLLCSIYYFAIKNDPDYEFKTLLSVKANE